MKPSTRHFTSLELLAAAAGQDLGVSDWIPVTQQMVDLFADATGDRQWIHVDPERAAGGAFGATIAHGYLTLSLVPVLVLGVYSVNGVASVLNYGADGIRFPSPVRIPARLRGHVRLLSAEPSGSGRRVVLSVSVESEGDPKPACVVQVTYLMFPEPEHQVNGS